MELLRINYESEQPTVSARELHEGLEISERFQSWFNRQLQYGFEENTDYVGLFSIVANLVKNLNFKNSNIKGKDYVGGLGMPFLEAVVAGTRCYFVGKTACEQARELVILEGKGEFYGDNLFYMLSPTTFYIGDYNCHPCDVWCCLAGCAIKGEPPTPVRVHKTYWRVWAFTTFIYDIKRDNQKYESVNSNIVVVRSNFLPVPFDVAYIPPGVSHIRYWSKNEIMFCEPDLEPLCPWDCGTEYKVGGDDDFFLRDEVPVPDYLKLEVGEF